MIKQLKNLKSAISDLVKEELIKIKGLDIYVVTGVNDSSNTSTNLKYCSVSIKRLNDNLSYDDVELLAPGLGNLKGIIIPPKVNDIVIVAFIRDSEKPIIIGNLFNIYTSNQDSKVDVRQNELFITPKANGSYLFFRNDGALRLLNEDGYGFEIDESNNITIRGVTVDFTTTPRS